MVQAFAGEPARQGEAYGLGGGAAFQPGDYGWGETVHIAFCEQQARVLAVQAARRAVAARSRSGLSVSGVGRGRAGAGARPGVDWGVGAASDGGACGTGLTVAEFGAGAGPGSGPGEGAWTGADS